MKEEKRFNQRVLFKHVNAISFIINIASRDEMFLQLTESQSGIRASSVPHSPPVEPPFGSPTKICDHPCPSTELSGESDTDLLKKAHEIFFADQAKKFTLEHAWCTLRFEQKWLSLNAPKAGNGEKRKNVETTTQPSTTDGVVDVEQRPEGIKAAKARRNGGKGKSVSDYASVWEMKKEDWEMKKEDLERKERLSKLAILDTLLGRTQPLSEAEEDVKNRLLAECF
ncbi:hypothetical protein F2Q70_00043755 [Brassica cretica]|uniref:No apical meristem-associated C-terminal domain-containing protein n=1 Tax=Brassica cretica TaxID=69181 RepID=A0A8S9KNX4_BRACR|nr:hypothetical protein F2Q70_00043755 [Brassica cretica]